MGTCTTCELTSMRDRGEAPPWDLILRTPFWDVVHAFDTSIEGWLVLVLRRHLTAIADLTDDEAGALGLLTRDSSRALAEVVGCDKTYVVQLAEHPDHPHVHVHVVPRSAGDPEDLKGIRVFGGLGVAPEAAVTDARMTELASELRAALARA